MAFIVHERAHRGIIAIYELFESAKSKKRVEMAEWREMNPKERNPRESPFLRLLKYP